MDPEHSTLSQLDAAVFAILCAALLVGLPAFTVWWLRDRKKEDHEQV